MSLREPRIAYVTYPAIQLCFVLAACAATAAVSLGSGRIRMASAALAAGLVYPMAWYGLRRFVPHGRWLYEIRRTAALRKRVRFDRRQDPHRLEVLFGAPSNTLPAIALIALPPGDVIGGAGAAAAFSAALLTTCFYEFVHRVQHLNRKPKNRFIPKMKRHRLAHHSHDETGNDGIVSFGPDRMLGTFHASARDRPKSASAHDLGYGPEEARRYPRVLELTGAPPRDEPAGFAARQAP